MNPAPHNLSALTTDLYEFTMACGYSVIVDLNDKKTEIPVGTEYSDLLVPVFCDGELVYRTPAIQGSRDRTREQLRCAPPEILRLEDPENYTTGLEESLYELRSKLIARAKERCG
jgi:nicotinate phosphoribosyltransferase